MLCVVLWMPQQLRGRYFCGARFPSEYASHLCGTRISSALGNGAIRDLPRAAGQLREAVGHVLRFGEEVLMARSFESLIFSELNVCHSEA